MVCAHLLHSGPSAADEVGRSEWEVVQVLMHWVAGGEFTLTFQAFKNLSDTQMLLAGHSFVFY